MKIGKPKYGTEYTRKKYEKLKDGEATYRILPPLGDLADEGRWSVFYSIHYGYRNSKGDMRVFVSPLVKNRSNGMVEVPDAALERIQNLRSELEKAQTSGNKGAVTKLKDLLQQYNMDNNHYVNAIDLQGNIVILKLRHRAKQALDAAIKKLRDSGVDPLGPDNGRFFTFTRTGIGRDTTFQVAVAQETLKIADVGEVKREIVHRLTPDILDRLGKEAGQLDRLFKKLTADEVSVIVKESDLLTGKSPAIDFIFDSKSQITETDSSEESTETTTSTAASSTSTNSSSVTTQTKVEPTSNPPMQGSTQQFSQMSDEEFLASIRG